MRTRDVEVFKAQPDCPQCHGAGFFSAGFSQCPCVALAGATTTAGSRDTAGRVTPEGFCGLVPVVRAEATIAEDILATLAVMRQSGTFATSSLCWGPAELELLAMGAIAARRENEEAKKERERVRDVQLRRHRRLSAALGLDDGYSVDAAIDEAIRRVTPVLAVTEGSVVRENAERDPKYRPYCLRCDDLMPRMEIIEPFFWRCARCGAEHDERTAATQEPR